MKLLILDDQKSVHVFLEKCIYQFFLPITEIQHAYCANEALSLITNSVPDLMILDIQMPGMTGIELLDMLSHKGINISIIVLSAYDEFDYARSCIKYGVTNYLLKPIDIDELKNALEDVINKKKQESTKNVCREIAEISDLSSIDSTVISCPDYIINTGFGIGFLCCLNGSSFSINNSNDLMCMNYVSIKQYTVFFLQCVNQSRWKNLSTELNLSFGIGISQFSTKTDNIVPLVKQAITALTQTFYEDKPIYYKENVFMPMPNDISPLESIGEKLQTAYYKQDISSIRALSNDMFSFFYQNNVSPDIVKNYLIGFFGRINISYFRSYKLIENNTLSCDFESISAEDLRSVFLRIILSMLANINPEHIRSDDDVILEIKKYIDRHCDADLSLTTLSGHFYMSKFQISRLFKNKFECNLSNYILQVRMNNATQYLTSTDKKLSEICTLVGYEDVSYFSNVFKKHFGKSPSEYRTK